MSIHVLRDEKEKLTSKCRIYIRIFFFPFFQDFPLWPWNSKIWSSPNAYTLLNTKGGIIIICNEEQLLHVASERAWWFEVWPIRTNLLSFFFISALNTIIVIVLGMIKQCQTFTLPISVSKEIKVDKKSLSLSVCIERKRFAGVQSSLSKANYE